MIVVLLAGSFLGPIPSADMSPRPSLQCSLQHLSACENINRLIWDEAFQRQVELFTGRARIDALGGGLGALSEDLLDTLGGPPDPPIHLPDGNTLFTACVAHNCTEKGAIVLTPGGSIVAAAMLTTHNQHEKDRKWTGADSEYSRLDILVRSQAAANNCHAAIIDWAMAGYRSNRGFMHSYSTSLGLTETLWLIRPNTRKLSKVRTRKLV